MQNYTIFLKSPNHLSKYFLRQTEQLQQSGAESTEEMFLRDISLSQKSANFGISPLCSPVEMLLFVVSVVFATQTKNSLLPNLSKCMYALLGQYVPIDDWARPPFYTQRPLCLILPTAPLPLLGRSFFAHRAKKYPRIGKNR